MGGGAVTRIDKVVAVAEFVIRIMVVVFVFCGIDFANGRLYEKGMAIGMIYLLMNFDRGGEA